MKKAVLLIVMVFTLSGCMQIWALTHYNNTYLEKVTRVIDAKTFVTEDKDGKIKGVILYGITVQKKYTKEGREAAVKLSNLVMGKMVKFTVKGVDNRNRMISVAFLEGDKISLNHRLIKNGVAKINKEKCKLPECRDWK